MSVRRSYRRHDMALTSVVPMRAPPLQVIVLAIILMLNPVEVVNAVGRRLGLNIEPSRVSRRIWRHHALTGESPLPPFIPFSARDASVCARLGVVRRDLADDDARMRRRPLSRQPYKALPPELRPRYKKSADFRLLRRAIREGWANDVCPERVAEWDQDLVEAMAGPRTRRIRVAAIKVFLEVERQKTRRIMSYYQLRSKLLPIQIEIIGMCEDDQGRVRAELYEALWGRVLRWFTSGADPEEFPASAFEQWMVDAGVPATARKG